MQEGGEWKLYDVHGAVEELKLKNGVLKVGFDERCHARDNDLTNTKALKDVGQMV